VCPDLEYYINNNILHVLNTEHTFYVDNEFLKEWIESYGFQCISESRFQNHSVTFVFKRTRLSTKFTGVNSKFNLTTYFSKLYNTIELFNKTIQENPASEVYLWPASIHTLTLLNTGMLSKISGLADNSKTKINKFMYGYNLPIVSFQELIAQDLENHVLLLHGGVFNTEVKNKVERLKNTRYVFGT
jgi:hypothetical protein